jgi:hypothetical protein
VAKFVGVQGDLAQEAVELGLGEAVGQGAGEQVVRRAGEQRLELAWGCDGSL